MAALLHLAEGDVAAQGWWSLQPLAKVDLPSDGMAKHPIDAFVQQRLAKAGLVSSPLAEPRTLVRRLHFDLLGFHRRRIQ